MLTITFPSHSPFTPTYIYTTNHPYTHQDVVRGDVDEEDVMDTDIVSPDISAMNGDTAIAAAATAAAVSRLVEASDAQLADLRVRLAAGLKHHFHSKHMEGLLAAKVCVYGVCGGGGLCGMWVGCGWVHGILLCAWDTTTTHRSAYTIHVFLYDT